jgi:Cellulase (glycosyl hydrolase family 5)
MSSRWLAVLALAVATGCGGPTSTPPPNTSGAPWLTLPAGSPYFEAGGRRAPVVMRNVSAANAADFTPLFSAARANGTTLVRLQLTQGLGYDTLGIDSGGGVLPAFAGAWDSVLDQAAQQNLAVVVVFAIWGDWNDGTPDQGWVHFTANPLNQVLGGPAATPADLFSDTPTQRDWLAWVSALVTRWSGRANVVAWESFSELDLASGSTETNATAFASRAAATIRAADPLGRPVFASTSDLPLLSGQPWTTFWASDGVDLASLHVYASDLDRAIIDRTQAARALTDKPIFVGESGLDAAAPDGTTLTTSTAAPIGLQSAIWAELVAGSATARALYWEDGYAAYYPQSGLPLVTARNDLERGAADWLADKDYRGLVSLGLTAATPLVGATVGAADRVLGWARNPGLLAPSWDVPPLDPLPIGVTLPAGSADGPWAVTLTSPDDGSTSQVAGAAHSGTLTFSAVSPFNRIAFDAIRNAPAP